MSSKDYTFDEDNFLLDYVEYRKGNIKAYDYAHKYNLTVWELLNKLRDYCLYIAGGSEV